MSTHQSQDSRLSFVEKVARKKGQEIVTALYMTMDRKQKAVAHIYLDIEKESQTELFVSYDAKGAELFPPTEDLDDLKYRIVEIEAELARVLAQHERDQHKEREQRNGRSGGLER